MASFKQIPGSELQSLLNTRPIQVVDVRDPMSFQAGHIQNAHHIDNDTVARFIEQTDLNQALVVCCYHGKSSQNVAEYLANQGFTEVYSLEGGYEVFKTQYPELCSAS